MTKYTQEDLDLALAVNISNTRFPYPSPADVAQLIADTREAATKAERERTSELRRLVCAMCKQRGGTFVLHDEYLKDTSPRAVPIATWDPAGAAWLIRSDE